MRDPSRRILVVLGSAAVVGLLIWTSFLRSTDRSVEEAFPEAGPDASTAVEAGGGDARELAAVTESQDAADASDQGADALEDATSEVGASENAEALLLLSGSFHDIDADHRGSGDATIYRLAGGGHLLRLESLDVTKGPDLFVTLSTHPDPATVDELHQEGFVELEPLKGNRGDQNYTLPAGLDPEDYASVAIYCRRFSVLFSVAPLQ